MIKYIKSVHWRVAKRLSYIKDARCLKVKKGPAGMEIFGSKMIHVIGKTVIMVTIIWSPFIFVLRNYLKY